MSTVQLTRDEWKRNVEIAAAHKHGENNAGWYVFRRYGAGPLGVLILAGLAGYGVYWLWHHVHLPSGSGPAGLPVAFWILAAVLAIGTLITLRPSDTFRPFSIVLLRTVVLGLLWLGVVVYAVTVII